MDFFRAKSQKGQSRDKRGPLRGGADSSTRASTPSSAFAAASIRTSSARKSRVSVRGPRGCHFAKGFEARPNPSLVAIARRSAIATVERPPDVDRAEQNDECRHGSAPAPALRTQYLAVTTTPAPHW